VKIVYVCADRGVPLLGNKGASVHLRSLATALAGRGNQVTLVCANVRGENSPPAGVRVEELPAVEEVHELYLTGLYTAVGADVVLERYSLSSGPAQAAARMCRIPFVLEVNAPLVDEAARYRGLEEVERWRSWEQQVLASADRVIAVSPAIRGHLLQLAVDPGRVAVIHNGVDLGSFDGADGRAIRTRHGFDAGTIVVGFSGSLKPWHGVDTLIEAVATLPASVRLLIVGDGPQRAELERLAGTYPKPDWAVFTGAVPHTQVPAHLAAMDIAVAPYLPQENFYFSPLKVIEYLAAGLPVVASDQGDMRLLVGEAGIVVPAGDSDALAAAVGGLSSDPDLRGRLAAAARPLARDRDWTKVAARVEAVLAALKKEAA
jgi:glycosyltransferase involved in cell wall biosynthesis